MKQICFSILCALAVLTSCEKHNNHGGTITLKRADISGAKYLTLAGGSDTKAVGKAATETSRLYKIDDKGNMTAVIFYVEGVYDDGGNRTGEVEATQDIVVSPRSIVDYGEKYILLAQCTLTQISGKYSGIGMGQYQNFLIRKTDGAIFGIGSDQISSFYTVWQNDPVFSHKITYNAQGDLYMIGNDLMTGKYNVSKLKLENEKLMLQQVTTGIDANTILVDKDDNLYVCSCDYLEQPSHGYIYFPGGGVAMINEDPFIENHNIVLLIDNEYYLFNTILINSEYRYKLSKIKLNAPNLILEEIGTLPYFSEFYPSNNIIYAGSKVLFFSSNYAHELGVYDKSTKKLSTALLSDEFRNQDYNRQGIAYEYLHFGNLVQLTKYNVVDMTKRIIPCDRSAVPPFVQIRTQRTSTDFFEFGIKSSNGAPIRIQTNFETGKVTVHEDADDRTITELIKVS